MILYPKAYFINSLSFKSTSVKELICKVRRFSTAG